MEISFWTVFNLLVAATTVLLAFFISYYFLSLKKYFPPALSSSCQRMAQGFVLLLGISVVCIIGGIFGVLPIGKINTLSMLMLPSLLWALLLLYEAVRKLGTAYSKQNQESLPGKIRKKK